MSPTPSLTAIIAAVVAFAVTGPALAGSHAKDEGGRHDGGRPRLISGADRLEVVVGHVVDDVVAESHYLHVGCAWNATH